MEVPSQPTHQIDDRTTRRSLLAGIVVWFLHQNIIYAMPSLSCKWDWLSSAIAGTTGLVLFEALITLVAVGLMAYLIYVPYRNWRAFQTEKRAGNPRMLEDTEKDRRPLVAFIAMGLNLFFILFMIATFVPVFALNACGQG